jgi:sensor histidine kinase YesM
MSKQRRIGFRNLLLLSTTLLMLLFMFLISLQSYESTLAYIKEKLKTSTNSDVMQLKRKFDDQLDQIRSITVNLSDSSMLKQNLAIYEEGDANERLQARKFIQALFAKAIKYNDYIQSIVVFTDREAIYSGTRDFHGLLASDIEHSSFGSVTASQDRLKLIEPSPDYPVATSIDPMEFLLDNYSFATSIEEDGESRGIIFVILKAGFLDGIYQDSGNLLILRRDGEVLWDGRQDKEAPDNGWQSQVLSSTGKTLTMQETKGISIYSIAYDSCDWLLVQFTDSSDFVRLTSGIRLYFLFAFLVVVVISLALSRLFAGLVTNPMRRLIGIVQAYRVKSVTNRLFKTKSERSSLKSRILAYFVWVVIIPIIAYSIFSYLFYLEKMESYIISSNRESFDRTLENLSFFLRSKEKAGDNIIYDETVQSQMKKPATPATNQTVSELYYQNLVLQDGNDDLFLFDLADTCLFSSRTDLPEMYLHPQGSFVPSGDDPVINWTYGLDPFQSGFLHMTLKVNDLVNYGMIGYARISIPEVQIESIYRGMSSDSVEVFIIDSKGTIVSHPDKSRIGTPSHLSLDDPSMPRGLFQPSRFTLDSAIGKEGWFLVAEYSQSFFDRDVRNLIYEKLYILLMAISLTLLIALLISKGISAFVRRYGESLQKLAIEGFDADFRENSRISEFDSLGLAFNEMVVRTENLMDQLLVAGQQRSELIGQKRDAEIVALQAQINPHFLYNTFESINWMIKRDKKSEATRMIRLLSEMLRFAARSDNSVITLGEELKYTNSYMDIMRMRFRDEIAFGIDSDTSLMHCRMPKLILQPLVENAIYHGIAPKRGNGSITIQCSRDGDHLVIRIEDDGIGMNQDELDRINQILQLQEYKDRIGVFNVQTRIRLMFGPSYGITFSSRTDGGTVAHVKIPFIDEPDD